MDTDFCAHKYIYSDAHKYTRAATHIHANNAPFVGWSNPNADAIGYRWQCDTNLDPGQRSGRNVYALRATHCDSYRDAHAYRNPSAGHINTDALSDTDSNTTIAKRCWRLQCWK